MSILNWLRRFERALAATLLCGIVAAVFIGSVGRYTGYPVLWTDEVAQGLFIWTSMLAADLTLQRGGHFRIDMLTSLLPAPAQHWLELATKLLLAATLCLLAWHGLQLGRMMSPRPLPMTGISSAAALAALPVGFALMLVTIVEQFAEQWRRGTLVHVQTRDVI